VTLNVDPAPLTVTANSGVKSYGQALSFAGTEFTTSGLQNSETVGWVTLASAGAASTAPVAGSPYTIVPGAAAGGTFAAANYTITYVDGALTVNPASLTITANNASKYFLQSLSLAGTEFATSGLQNSETVGSVTLTSAGAASTATVANSPYAIQPSAATGGTFAPANYTAINYVNGVLTVKPVGSAPTITSVLPNAGPNTGGTTVTITGTGFEPGATVAFGSLSAASVTFVSSTVLTAVTPSSSSGTVPVVLANPDGNKVTDAGAFAFGTGVTITGQPLATQSVNQGQTVQLTVQATGDPTLTYQWQFNGANLLDNGHTTGTKGPSSVTGTWTGNVAIGDNDPNGVSENITFSGTTIRSITDVTVSLNIAGALNGAGAYDGDYYCYLTSSSGGFTVLLNRIGVTATSAYGSAASGFNVTFSDNTLGDIHNAPTSGGPVTGTWQPDARTISPANVLDTSPRSASAFLSSFNGLNPNCTWTLFVADLSPGGVGNLESWGLTVTGNVIAVPEPSTTLAGLIALAFTTLWPVLRLSRRACQGPNIAMGARPRAR
jgi:subtilisin-like proprotein convertase family protein